MSIIDNDNHPAHPDHDATKDRDWHTHRPGSPEQGAALRAAALTKMRQAAALLTSAREDLCNLEGHGYCRIYERTLKHLTAVSTEATNLSYLAPPTGVFRI
jgi:hypothetical protein